MEPGTPPRFAKSGPVFCKNRNSRTPIELEWNRGSAKKYKELSITERRTIYRRDEFYKWLKSKFTTSHDCRDVLFVHGIKKRDTEDEDGIENFAVASQGTTNYLSEPIRYHSISRYSSE